MLGWTVEVRDSSLVRVGQLSENDLTAFLAIPRMNSLGSWSIRLPNTVLNASGVRVPHALCAVLRTQGSGVIVTGPHGVVLTGPMTFAEMEATSDDPSGQWEIQGTSDLVEIAKSLAYPQPSNSSVSSQSVSNDVRSGLGEALMRAYISSNIGPAASVARRLPDLSLAADGGLGVSLSKSPRFQNLLELTQEIALGSELLFDVVQVGSGREFRVSAPQDVSALVRWDIANNQLSKSKYGYSAPGVTRVFVAGQGEGSARTIVEVTTVASLLSEAIWGRIERFVDQRNTDDVDELTQAGLEVLATEGTTVTSLEVVPSSAMADGFGVDWFLGSWVTVVVNDQQIRAQVVEVPISITSSDGVLVGAVVGDATGFDWQAILAAKQSKTEKRVSALEQNAENGGGGGGSPGTAGPAGSIMAWAATTPPANWLICDGSAVSRTSYASLFNVIATNFGVGDGSSTFNLPDLRGRVPVGKDAGTFGALAGSGGAETHLLTAAQSGLPSHTHQMPMGTNGTPIGAGDVPQRSQGPGDSGFRTSVPTASSTYGSGLASSSASSAHNNLQPYLVLNYIIKTTVGETPGDSELATRVGSLETSVRPVALGGTGGTTGAGLAPVIPTSVTVTAGSASIASDGTITMAASVGLLAINVFSAQYRNYVMVFSAGTNISDQGAIRFGTGGTQNVTSNYSYSTLYNSAGAGSHGNENSVSYMKLGYVNTTIKSHYEFKIFSPFDSGSTTGVEVLGGYSGVGDWTHGFFALNTSFTDMFVNTYNGRALTGTVKFYGYN
jgi:microcystin-dependent protein